MNYELETKKIYKHFDGVKAVNHLSLSLATGKITGIVGPNGSGKSTFVNLLTGVIPFDGGEVMIGKGLTLKKILPYENKTYGITRTFQDVRLFEQLTVMDNILVLLTERNLWGSIFERHGKFHLDKAKEVLTRVGLWEKRYEKAINLSYGQRKLLEIARVIAMNSQIIFLDEPFAGIFKEMIKVVVTIIKELREEGKTIVLIEHNMELIRELSDYLIVMDAGEILAEGKPSVVLEKKEVIEAYLGT